MKDEFIDDSGGSSGYWLVALRRGRRVDLATALLRAAASSCLLFHESAGLRSPRLAGVRTLRPPRPSAALGALVRRGRPDAYLTSSTESSRVHASVRRIYRDINGRITPDTCCKPLFLRHSLEGNGTHNAGVEGSSPSLSTNSISVLAIGRSTADSP